MDPNSDPSYRHLMAIDWCANLINNSNYRIAVIKPPSSTLEAEAEGELMNKTLRTDSTIRSMLCLYKIHNEQVQETLILHEIGHGLNGLPGIIHGGMTATLLDGAAGIFVSSLFGPLGKSLLQPVDKDLCPIIWADTSTATLRLDISYLKFIKTPSVIAIRSRLKELKGRKALIENQVEDENQNVLAKADALFIIGRKSNI